MTGAQVKNSIGLAQKVTSLNKDGKNEIRGIVTV